MNERLLRLNQLKTKERELAHKIDSGEIEYESIKEEYIDILDEIEDINASIEKDAKKEQELEDFRRLLLFGEIRIA